MTEQNGTKAAVTCIVVGAGNRSYAYSTFSKIFPGRLKIIGVAEPRDKARKLFQQRFDVPEENVFKDWHEVASKPKFADFVMITTPDREHAAPAIAFANLGYHLLLEKPMAVTENDCKAITDACKANNRREAGAAGGKKRKNRKNKGHKKGKKHGGGKKHKGNKNKGIDALEEEEALTEEQRNTQEIDRFMGKLNKKVKKIKHGYMKNCKRPVKERCGADSACKKEGVKKCKKMMKDKIDEILVIIYDNSNDVHTRICLIKNEIKEFIGKPVNFKIFDECVDDDQSASTTSSP